MKELRLSNGKNSTVDDKDFEFLSKFKWREADGYAARTSSKLETGVRRTILLHKLLMGEKLGYEVDHKNRNRLDNRRDNFRWASSSENKANVLKRSGASSQYKGVCWDLRKNCWRAHVGSRKNKKHLGYFKDEVEAAKIYDKAAFDRWGEFAYLNFSRRNC